VPYRKTGRIIPLAAAAVFSSVTVWSAAAAEDSALCPDLLYLIEQSGSGFSSIREDTKSELGGTDAALVLSGASNCAILEDVETTSYRCAWTFPQGDAQAHATFERLAQEMRACIGERAEEQTDRSVNHPDFYASHYYDLPEARASVALKDKSNLRSTLVSIRIDGRAGTN
jgi:hypothetical protein